MILLPKPTVTSSETKAVPAPYRALVVPHHDVVLEKFPSFYEQVPNPEQITRVIVLSPNHYQPGSSVVKLRKNNFVLADARLEVDGFLAGMIGVTEDDAVFANEHGVAIHLPFIGRYFPNAQVTPVLLTRNVSRLVLDELVAQIGSVADDKTLLLVSTDFSHGLSASEAELKDAETLRLLAENNAEKILELSDEYLDCPGCLYVLMKLEGAAAGNFRPIFHGNSAQYLSLENGEPTTSYYVLGW